MADASKTGSWWHTLPGVLTAIATVLTAVTGLIVAFSQAGLFKGNGNADGDDAVIESGLAPNTDVPARATSSAQKNSGLRVGSVRNQNASIHNVDNPLPAAIGTTYKLTLDAEEASYFRFTAPGEMKVVFDMRLPKNEFSNLQSGLLLLDQDGTPIGRPIINFNEVDDGHRIVSTVALKQGTVGGLKVLNGGKLAYFWLTLLTEPATQFIPFFGEVVPQRLNLGAGNAGALEPNESVYFAGSLVRGEYKVFLDFANADRTKTNIQGYLALLDADGGDQRILIRLNEVDVSYRKTETFTLTRDKTIIVRIHNATHPVNYTLRIVRA